MASNRVHTALPDPPSLSEEENKEEEKVFGNIFAELESVDLPLGTTLRSIYDDQPNAHKRFMEKLDARIRNHDREIEKMCNFHHQGFVDAITELLKVRADAEKLMLLSVSADFQQLCDGVYEALVVEIAHLFNLTVMVPYPGIQLFHEALVGVGLVIVNRSERDTRDEETGAGNEEEG
ncbi:Exocyst complex component 6, partial [Dissostichus eleginoides]